MTTELETTEQRGELITFDEPVTFDATDEMIAGLRKRLDGLKADTPANYELVRAGLAEVRTLRTGVERSRKELKAPATAYGKRVDAEAKRITGLLVAIESPLKAAKDAADKERAAAEQAAREAEQKRIDDELARRKTEREKLDAERAELDAERKRIEIEREQLERDIEETRRRVAEAANPVADQSPPEPVDEEKQKLDKIAGDYTRRRMDQMEAAGQPLFETCPTEDPDAECKAVPVDADRVAAKTIPVTVDLEQIARDREALLNYAGKLQQIKVPEMQNDWFRQRFNMIAGNVKSACNQICDLAAEPAFPTDETTD
jgi:hypothetical protein